MKGNLVITISRQYGSGGRQIGEIAAREMGIPFYDRDIIRLAAGDSQIDESFFQEKEQRKVGSLLFTLAAGLGCQTSLNDRIYLAQVAIVRELASQGSCVIAGHCAGEILRDRKHVLRVAVTADMEERKRRIIEEYGDAAAVSEDYIREIDESRARYGRFYFSKKWERADNYDLCLNSSVTGIEGSAGLIRTACGLLGENCV